MRDWGTGGEAQVGKELIVQGDTGEEGGADEAGAGQWWL